MAFLFLIILLLGFIITCDYEPGVLLLLFILIWFDFVIAKDFDIVIGSVSYVLFFLM